jgi:uncharacterized protein
MHLRRGATGAAFALLAVLLLFATAVGAAEPVFPPLTGRVVDEAGILSPQTRQRLDALLAQHEQSHGQQVVVVTLKSLQGYSIEDFGYQLGRHWGIGEKDKNTGALLVVAPNERKVRIEAGYGLEGQLTDAQSRSIIEGIILPAFRQGDFNGGVLDGATAIVRVLGGSPAREGQQPAPQGAAPPFQLFMGLAVILLGWLVFRGLLLPLLLVGATGRRQGFGYGYGGGFSSGGGGFSGGGFSGGGGSFGGGGASGGW